MENYLVFTQLQLSTIFFNIKPNLNNILWDTQN